MSIRPHNYARYSDTGNDDLCPCNVWIIPHPSCYDPALRRSKGEAEQKSYPEAAVAFHRRKRRGQLLLLFRGYRRIRQGDEFRCHLLCVKFDETVHVLGVSWNRELGGKWKALVFGSLQPEFLSRICLCLSVSLSRVHSTITY